MRRSFLRRYPSTAHDLEKSRSRSNISLSFIILVIISSKGLIAALKIGSEVNDLTSEFVFVNGQSGGSGLFLRLDDGGRHYVFVNSAGVGRAPLPADSIIAFSIREFVSGTRSTLICPGDKKKSEK